MAEISLKLVVQRGSPGLKPEYPLNQQVITIGRSLNNLIVLQDTKVSRYHAEIVKVDKEYVIKDLESANGIRVNGSRCLSKTLEPRDLIQIGDTEFKVELSVSRLEQLEIKDADAGDALPAFDAASHNTDAFSPRAASTARAQSIPAFNAPAPSNPSLGLDPSSRLSRPPALSEPGEVVVPPFGKVPAFGEGASPMTLPPMDVPLAPGPPPVKDIPGAGPAGVFGRRKATPGDLAPDQRMVTTAPTSHKLLEHVRVQKGTCEIGGMESLTAWLGRRAKAFTAQAKAFGLPEPSGITVVGGPGCGKTLVTRYVAASWNVNFFRLHLPYLLFTAPEVWMKSVSEALNQVLSYQPALLAIEDVDRMMDRVEMMGDEVKRAYLMTVEVLAHWVHTKGPSPFTIITGTSPRAVHPDLMRKGGSLDEVFYIDLPQNWERQQIIEAILLQRNRFPDRFDLRSLVEATEAFSGAQISEGILSAMYDAFSEGREPATADLINAFGKILPQGHIYGTFFEELRQWALVNARPAAMTLQEKQAVVGARQGPAPYKVSPLHGGSPKQGPSPVTPLDRPRKGQ